MCGIAGIFRTDGQSAASGPELREALARIAHRGPDAEGFFVDGSAAFANCRLAVIDPDHGDQPMESPDGRFALTYNGEIHDFEEHRTRLESEGVEFAGRSDTEVLLRLLEREGTPVLDDVSGMFAFGLLDRADAKLVLARDPYGIKPLLYAAGPAGLRFGSEAAALTDGTSRIDHEALLVRLAFQVPLTDRTLVKGVRSLDPGSMLLATADGSVTTRRWFDNPFEPDESRSEAEWAEELADAIHRAVRISLRSDVPLGVTLSGGLDSSLVAGIAAAETGERLTAYTGYFEEGAAFDEREHARAAAEEIGVRLVEVPIRPADLTSHLRELALALDGPIAGPGSLPQLVVAGRAREDVTVLLTGQGADEIFGGYARMRIAWLEAAGRLDPDDLPDDLVPYRPLVKHLHANGNGESFADRYFRLVYRGGGLDDLLGDAIRDDWLAFDAKGIFHDVFTAEDGDPFHQMVSYETRVLLPALLHVEDRVTMARSLESRVPLLDPAITKIAARIPASIAFGQAEPKRILRKAAEGLAPPSSVTRRDKMGFPVPLGPWARGPLREELRERLEDGPLVREGILRAGAPERLLDAAGGHGRHLWFFLLLSEWMSATGARP